MKLISWNVNCPGAERITRLSGALDARKPDIVTLQEVAGKRAETFLRELHAIGLEHFATSLRESAGEPAGEHLSYGVLIASRWPFQVLANDLHGLPYAESFLSVLVESPWGPVEVHTAHIPNGSSHSWKKIYTFEWVYERLKRKCDFHRILTGDFNSPQRELEDGRVVTFGQHIYANGRVSINDEMDDGPGERWHEGELNVISGLAEHDLADAYRLIHGYRTINATEDTGYSFCTRRSGERRFRRRFDHVFASRSLNPLTVEYLLEYREAGYSDHAPIEVHLSPVQL